MVYFIHGATGISICGSFHRHQTGTKYVQKETALLGNTLKQQINDRRAAIIRLLIGRRAAIDGRAPMVEQTGMIRSTS